MSLIRQPGFFEQDRHLHAVGRGQRIQLQPLGVQGGPFAGDGKGGQIGHGVPRGECRPQALKRPILGGKADRLRGRGTAGQPICRKCLQRILDVRSSYVNQEAHRRPATGPARLLAGLVVLVFPCRAAAVAAVAGDGDQRRAALFLAVAALHQFGMAGALRQLRWMPAHESAQLHLLQFVLSVQVLGHGVAFEWELRGDLRRSGRLSPLGPARRWRNLAAHDAAQIMGRIFRESA